MPSINARALRKRSDAAWAEKSQWQGLLSDVYRYALPMRNLYDQGHGQGTTQKGDEKMTGVYDSTAIMSTVAGANRLQSDLVPPFQQWADLEPGPFVPNELRDQVTRALQEAKRKGFALLHASNFDLQVNEFLLELMTGTAAMLVLERDDRDTPIIFETVPVAQVAFDEGRDGSVDGKYRKHRVLPRLVMDTWPDAKKLPAVLQKAVDAAGSEDEDGNPREFLECTYFDTKDKVWRYEVLFVESAQGASQEHRIVERTYTTDPWIVTRWIKVAGETQGRGPLMFALPDIRTANAVVALVLQNASFAVSGAFVGADDGVLNPQSVVVRPGAVIAAKHPDSLRPLEWGGRFDVAQLVLEDMRGNIRRMLYDERLPPMDASVRSATEIVERIKQLQQDIGSPFGRLMSEFIQPLWTRLIDIMAKLRLVPQPIVINGLTVRITATSPLARADASKELEIAMLWVQLLQQLGPEAVMLNVKVEDFGEWMADRLQVDRRLLRPAQERQAMQKMAGAVAAQQAGGPGPVGVQPPAPAQQIPMAA